MSSNKGFASNWLERVMNDPKLLFGSLGVIALLAMTFWAVISFTQSPDQEEPSERPKLQAKLGEGQQVSWTKTTGAEALNGTSSIGVSKLRKGEKIGLPGEDTGKGVSASANVPGAVMGTLDQIAAAQKAGAANESPDKMAERFNEALRQKLSDSTKYVQNTAAGPGGASGGGGMTNPEFVPTGGGVGLPPSSGGGSSSAGSAAQTRRGGEDGEGGPIVSAGAGTVAAAAGRTIATAKAPRPMQGGKLNAVQGQGQAAGRQGAAVAGEGRAAMGGGAAGGGGGLPRGGGGGGGEAVGGAKAPADAGGFLKGAGEGRGNGGIAGTPGMPATGGGGGGGTERGAMAGGGGGNSAQQDVQPMSKADVNKESQSIMTTAGNYYTGVVQKAITLEIQQVPALAQKADRAASPLESLKRTLESASRKYSGDAAALVGDTYRLVTVEQMPRLKSASAGISTALQDIAWIRGGCERGYYAQKYRCTFNGVGVGSPEDCAAEYQKYVQNNGGYWGYDGNNPYYYQGGMYEPYSEWVLVDPNVAVGAHQKLEAAITDAGHARDLASTFGPMAADEYGKVAAQMRASPDPATRSLAQDFASLGVEVARREAEVCEALPSGLTSGRINTGDLKDSTAKGYGEVRTCNSKIKSQNLAYPQTAERDSMQRKMSSAMTHAGEAADGAVTAASSLPSLVRAGMDSVRAYTELCEAKTLMDTVASQAK